MILLTCSWCGIENGVIWSGVLVVLIVVICAIFIVLEHRLPEGDEDDR